MQCLRDTQLLTVVTPLITHHWYPSLSDVLPLPFPILKYVCPEITSYINCLYLNPQFRIYFWGNCNQDNNLFWCFLFLYGKNTSFFKRPAFYSLCSELNSPTCAHWSSFSCSTLVLACFHSDLNYYNTILTRIPNASCILLRQSCQSLPDQIHWSTIGSIVQALKTLQSLLSQP